MSKVPGIAWREFKHTALTKAFIIGSIVVPILCLPVFIILPALLQTETEPLKGTVVLIGPGNVVDAANDWASLDRRTPQREAIEHVLDQMPQGAVDATTRQMATSMTGSKTPVDLTFKSGTKDELDSLKKQVRNEELLAIAVLHDDILTAQPDRKQNRFDVFVRPGLSANHLELISDLVSEAVVQTRVASAGLQYTELSAMMRSPRSSTLRLQDGWGRGG